MNEPKIDRLKEKLPSDYKNLAEPLVAIGQFVELPAGYEVLREGQYVKVVPILLNGLVKVVTKGEVKDLLLYYIQPGESCMMSFIHSLNQKPCSVYATVEEPSEALLIPADKLEELIGSSSQFNKLFHELSNKRYQDLLSTINEVFFLNIEDRILNLLKRKIKLSDGTDVRITHKQIANDLGTAREVVSRTLKKLESNRKIKVTRERISLM